MTNCCCLALDLRHLQAIQERPAEEELRAQRFCQRAPFHQEGTDGSVVRYGKKHGRGVQYVLRHNFPLHPHF